MFCIVTSHFASQLKEHIALDRSSWSLKIVCNRLLQNAYGQKDILKVEYNDPYMYHSKLRDFPCASSTNTNFDSHKWPTVLVRRVKGNHAILRQMCVDHCILLVKHLSNHAFCNKRLQTLFKDQLVRSKATCSFKLRNQPQNI